MAVKQSTLQVKFVVDGDGKVKSVFNGITADAGKSGKAIDNLSKELQTLSERVDKNAAKTNQLGRDRAVLDDALKRGLITQKEHNRLLAQSTQQYDNVIAKARVAGAVLGTVLVAGVTAVFRATAEAEKVQAQLASGIADTAGAAQRSLPQLNALADTLQRATTFDDEAIGGVEKVLLTFTNIRGINFDKATASVLDLSIKLGTDLSSAAIQVGKALNDPILGVSALGRAGVQFSEDQKALIKSLVETGDVAAAQQIILAELEREMGTAAEAARNTLGGAVEGLTHDFENLLEGESGSSGVKGVTDAINQMSATLNDPDVKAGFQAIVEGILSVSSEILRGIGLIGQYIGKYREIAALGDGSLSMGDATDTALQNRLAAVGATLGNLKKGNTLTAFYGQDSALSAGDMLKFPSTLIKELTDERTKLIRQMTDRNRAEQGQLPLGVPAVADLGAALQGLQPFSLVGPAPFNPIARPAAGAAGAASAKKTGGAGAAAAADRGAAEAARERAKAERELQDQLEQVSQAQDDFKTRTEDLRAELEGPMAQAQLEYNRQLEAMRDLAKKGEIGATELADAERLLGEQFDQEAEAIRRRMDPGAELIKQLDDQLRLRTLNNAEARTAIDLANLSVPATREEAAAILERHRALQAQADVADAMDAFRDSSKNAFKAYADGSLSAAAAGKQFFDELMDKLFDLATNIAWEQLFGSQGSTNGGSMGGGIMGLFGALFGGGGGGGGTSTSVMNPISGATMTGGGSSGGGFWSSVIGLLGGLFGGGKASGGDVRGGMFYRVNENQPELLDWNGQTLLMMGAGGGRVRPMHDAPAGRGGDVYNITVPTVGRADNHTRLQTANETARVLRRAGRNQ